MSTYVIYIPGLGDTYDGFRRTVLGWWKLWGVIAVYVPITWYDGDDMASKLARINTAIGNVPKGNRIVVIGESAGATLALHVGQAHPHVERIITLCGVARRQTPISSALRRRAPAIDEAVRTLPNTSGQDVHSIRAVFDATVNKRWSTATGATPHVMYTPGHRIAIIMCLTVLAPLIANIAKK